MDAKHTPGPWSLETVNTQVGICHKVGPFPWREDRNNHACIYYDNHASGAVYDELLANARLIAAAPELLEALETAMRSLATYGPHPIIEAASRAAIAKAKGL